MNGKYRPLWRWHELCEAVGLETNEVGSDVSGISIDTRTLVPGDLFVALSGDPGPRFNVSERSDRDGHDYVDHAIKAGAAAILVHRTSQSWEPLGVPALIVDDTLDALWNLGRFARNRFQGAVVAVTGSSGKTTVKNFLGQALDAFVTPSSFNNHLGVPLSLAATPADTALAVYEIGTNHSGEIAPLAKLVRPDIALVLNVHPAHIEFFEDMDALRYEKLSIAQGLRSQENGTLICLDTIERSDLELPKNIVTFGKSADSNIKLRSFEQGVAHFETLTESSVVEVPGGGEHHAMSVLAAVAVLDTLGVDLRRIQKINLKGLPVGRGNRSNFAGVTLIDDSYNANPASMVAALKTLSHEEGRTIAIIGEMLELGNESEKHHISLAKTCVGIDQIYCVGEATRPLYERLPVAQRFGFCPNPELLDVKAIAKMLIPGDIVLLKASNRIFWIRNVVTKLGVCISESMPQPPE